MITEEDKQYLKFKVKRFQTFKKAKRKVLINQEPKL